MRFILNIWFAAIDFFILGPRRRGAWDARDQISYGAVAPCVSDALAAMIERHPELRLTASGTIRLDATARHDIDMAFQEVNDAHGYSVDAPDADASDPGQPGFGYDCEDFACDYIRAVVAKGYPRDTLRLAVCCTSEANYTWHAVALVITDVGVFCMSQGRDQVVGWKAIPATLWQTQHENSSDWIGIS